MLVYGLCAVLVVHSSAILPVRVVFASVFITGTTPTNGTSGKTARTCASVCTDAFFQARTMILHPWSSSRRDSASVRTQRSSGALSPYGK